MLRLNPNSKKIPFGGHHYHEYGTTFKGESFREVERKLKSFRLANNIPIGNPEQEILTYYASQWPYLVTSEEGEIETQSQQYLDYRAWVQKTWKKPPQALLSDKEIEPRWEVCKGCKFNQEYSHKETDESAVLARRCFVLRSGRDVPDYLGFCALHKADLGVFSLIKSAKDFTSIGEAKDCADCWLFEGK